MLRQTKVGCDHLVSSLAWWSILTTALHCNVCHAEKHTKRSTILLCTVLVHFFSVTDVIVIGKMALRAPERKQNGCNFRTDIILKL